MWPVAIFVAALLIFLDSQKPKDEKPKDDADDSLRSELAEIKTGVKALEAGQKARRRAKNLRRRKDDGGGTETRGSVPKTRGDDPGDDAGTDPGKDKPEAEPKGDEEVTPPTE